MYLVDLFRKTKFVMIRFSFMFLFISMLAVPATVYSLDLEQQGITVTGVVKDNTGETLPGVNITVKGTIIGVVSDINGKYSITVPNNAAVLLFSFVGFNAQEFVVGDRRVIDVTLLEDTQQIEEVVVIGYGSVRKSDVTGSIVSVNAEEMLKRNPITVGQGLQGAAAGVNVYRNSGNPTGDVTVRIRGVSTINNTADPLYVVDGIQAGRSISFLNPSDIESIEILKDASATAIYGAQGANGVILVTTKRGVKGQTRLNFTANYNVLTNSKKLDVLDAAGFAQMARTTAENDGFVIQNQAFIGHDSNLNSIDWQDEMTRVALQQNYNMSVTGGTDNTQAVMSVGYLNNDGVVLESNFKRFIARANVDYKVKEFIRTGASISYTYNQSHFTGNDGYRNLRNIATLIPTMDDVDASGKLINVPIRYDNGKWGRFKWEGDEGEINRDMDNPIAVAKTATDKGGSSRLFASAYLEISILKNLTFRSVGGLNYNNGFWNNYTPFNDRLRTQQSVPDRFELNENHYKTISMENYLTYNLNINQANRLNLMAGWSVSRGDGQNLNIRSDDFPVPSIRQINMSQNLATLNGGGGLNREERAQSFFGRVIYSLADRYVFTGTIRRDGSSNFPKNNLYGTFPSASLLWRVSEEGFMQSQNIFSKLNVRLGWGQVGNAGNSTNRFMDRLTSARITYYFYNASGSQTVAPGLAQTEEIDPRLKWETNETKNVGLEMGFLKNSLTLSVEYFIRDAKDLLLNRALRPSTGYDQIYTNLGQIRNKGFEFFVVYQKRAGDWSFNIKLNGSTLKNEIIDIGAPFVRSDGVDVNDGWNNWARFQNGYAITSFYGYRVEGIFQSQAELDAANALAKSKGATWYQSQSTKPGDYKFKDLTGKGYISPDTDREILGNGFPKLNYGLNVGVSYKNWDFNLFMYGIAGQQVMAYNYKKLTMPSGGGYHNILKEAANDSWSTSNTGAKFPRLSNKDLNENGRISDVYLKKGDFLRIQNIQIGYTFPKEILLPLKMESARIFAGIENLATITGYKGGDPEIGGNITDNNGITRIGLDYGRYPFPRTFSFGVSFGF